LCAVRLSRVAQVTPRFHGSPLTVKISDAGVMINDAKVEEADIAVTNGVIHVIDSVLLPPALDGGIY